MSCSVPLPHGLNIFRTNAGNKLLPDEPCLEEAFRVVRDGILRKKSRLGWDCVWVSVFCVFLWLRRGSSCRMVPGKSSWPVVPKGRTLPLILCMVGKVVPGKNSWHVVPRVERCP